MNEFPEILKSFEYVLNQISYPVIMYGKEGNLKWANNNLTKGLAYTDSELKQLNLSDLIFSNVGTLEENFEGFFKSGFIGAFKIILKKDPQKNKVQKLGISIDDYKYTVGAKANITVIDEDNFLAFFTLTPYYMTSYFARYSVDFFVMIDSNNKIVEYNDYFYEKFTAYKNELHFFNQHIREFIEEGDWDNYLIKQKDTFMYLKNLCRNSIKNWEKIYETDFETDSFSEWLFNKKGEWILSNNSLIGISDEMFSFAILKEEVSINEFDVRMEFDVKCSSEIIFHCFMGGLREGYRHTPDSNGFLFSIMSNQASIKKDSMSVRFADSGNLEKGSWMHVSVEKEGGRFTIYINGEKKVEYYDVNPKYKTIQNTCGLCCGDKTEFKNLKIFTKSSLLDPNEISNQSFDVKLRHYPHEVYKLQSIEAIYPYASGERNYYSNKDVRILQFKEVTELRETQKAFTNSLEKSERLSSENKILKNNLIVKRNIGVGQSKAYNHVQNLIKTIADTNSHVLFTGETGTGKDMAAKELHFNSNRNDEPFIKIDCAALPPQLLESELFGHEKGAFTGALERTVGKFEIAGSGTIFLDEIGNLELQMQSKLLRVLQDKRFERIGGTQTLITNARIISATNSNLEELIEQGKFRSDLYYRINTITIPLPLLKERGNDVLLLANHFILDICKNNNKNIPKIKKGFFEYLQNYSWPGNIRELRNAIEYTVLMTNDKKIGIEDLPASILKKEKKIFLREVNSRKKPNLYTKEEILDAIENSNWNLTQVAINLGIGRPSLYRLMKSFEINR